LRTKQESCFGPLARSPHRFATSPIAYLKKLNAEQCRAIEHGLADGASASAGGPLLIIAGAGSGKTNALAHRVAHLIIRPSPAAPPPR
jgi:hypothetical protein